MIVKIPLILDPQPEGGYSVTSRLLPELITEGGTVAEAVANAEDAFAAVVEIYEDRGRALPSGVSRWSTTPLTASGGGDEDPLS